MRDFDIGGIREKTGEKNHERKEIAPKDADLANVEKALKRAAKTARSMAEKEEYGV
jgi:hypothetical protein